MNEWGFFAVTPRIVRVEYKQLSHAEKWLYVCLKDLCGDKGVCFRTLRSLAEETDISLGSLSTMIPKLQKAGLIHAEKKRRSLTGKEVWHISIVDIWQLNRDYCSKSEQSTQQFVQPMNNNVQKLNESSLVCSEIERDCSNFADRRKNIEEQHTEEITVKNTIVASAIAEDNGGNKNTLPGFDLEETEKQPTVKANTAKQASAEVPQTSKRQVIPKRPKPVTSKPEPTPEEKALAARSIAIYNRIVEWRGYAFDNGGAVINERKYCKRLAEKYSDEQIEKFYTHLTTKDFKWSKPNYRFKVGAYELFTEAGSVLQQLKASDKTASNPRMPALTPSDEPDYNALLFGRQKWDQAAGKYLPVVN